MIYLPSCVKVYQASKQTSKRLSYICFEYIIDIYILQAFLFTLFTSFVYL